MNKKRILLVQLRQLGDILLTTPCVREIKNSDPNVELYFLSHKMGSLLLEGNPYIDKIFYYDEKKGLIEQFKLIRTLRSMQFDIVIDFMNNPRSALLTMLSGGKKRVSFYSARSFAYNVKIQNKKRSDYIVKEKFQLLEALNFEAKDIGLILPWGEEHLTPLRNILQKNMNFKDASIRVVLSPTHRRENRKWAIERYAQLADYLVENWQASVVWAWGPGEEAEVDHAMTLCKQQTYKAPKTSFRELAALIGNCDLFVGNSNGPSHVAVANNICSLQLHGHTNMHSWCPLNQRHRAIQSLEFGQTDATLFSITLEMVQKELELFKSEIVTLAQNRKNYNVRTSYLHKI